VYGLKQLQAQANQNPLFGPVAPAAPPQGPPGGPNSAPLTVSQADPNTDLQSITKLLKQVCYHLVEERQLKLDVWLSENRTQAEQKDFRDSVIDYYGKRGDNGQVRCMVTGLMLPGNFVTAGHIYKSATRGVGLSSFGLTAADIHAPRNGFVIATEIERHFDIKDLCFIYDPFRKCYVVHVLNPDIHSKIVVQQIRFSDLQGLTVFSEPKTPYRRLLNFHSKCAVVAAKDNGWVREENYVLNILDLADTQSDDDEDDFISNALHETYTPSTQLSIAHPIIASKFEKQDRVEDVVSKRRARVQNIVRRDGKVYCTVKYNNGQLVDIDQDNLINCS
jgi:hypothetical protein